MMSSASDMPAYLEGDQEEAAGHGAAIRAVAGGSIGALGKVAASTIPGFESMFVSGLMATAVGSIMGGFLGSLYSVRAESQTEIDIHEALESGQILVVVQADENRAETAVLLLEQNNGQNVEIHTIPPEQIE
jgi:outer membrane lipoprotein SlyB